MILSPGWWRIYFSRDIISETQSWEQMDKKQGRFFNFQNLNVLGPIWIFRIFSVQYIDLQYSQWHEIIQTQLGLNSFFYQRRNQEYELKIGSKVVLKMWNYNQY